MRQRTSYTTFLFLLFVFSLSANHVDEYISNYQDIAQREMKRSGIPASIIIAQGIHESSWGRGTLAVKSKNHFGIKCKDYWTGPTYYHKDDDYRDGKLIKSCFRAYNNVESSYIDHTDFLMEGDRYKELFTYNKTDYRRWAIGLKKFGYATDKQYAEKIIRIIEEHELYRFDEILEVIMEAPTFFIPTEFLKQEDFADPVVYTYHEETETSQPSIYEVVNTENPETQGWNYEVKKEEPKREEIRDYHYVAEEVYVQNDTELTSIIMSKNSNDKKVQHLARKPRMSGGTGPR